MTSRAAYQNQVIRELMALMDGHRHPHRARQSHHVRKPSASVVQRPVRYERGFPRTSTDSAKLQFLVFLAAKMENSLDIILQQGRARDFDAANDRVAYDVISWVYFHERIVHILKPILCFPTHSNYLATDRNEKVKNISAVKRMMLVNLGTMLELGKDLSLALDNKMIREAISWIFFHNRCIEGLNVCLNWANTGAQY
ncbi:hypothetical protein B0T18DRAFT_394185 [Schizothecium vesticola]|uniref:Uncharacterized protein n=1 Tax=Schizothecium vesticola TaxID=314040 RepID=A0AA40BP32_9PEZI|nr:hypothetical protein B0T18DRAFT_394185 [Schizothecium vesticola]